MDSKYGIAAFIFSEATSIGNSSFKNGIESAYGIRLFIKNHIKLEEIPRGEQDTRLEKELARFQSHREDIDQKVKTFQSEQAQKQKDLFAELGKKLKSGLTKDKP